MKLRFDGIHLECEGTNDELGSLAKEITVAMLPRGAATVTSAALCTLRVLDWGERRITAIQALRTYLNCSLQHAKELIEAPLPYLLLALDAAQTTRLIDDLRAAGVTVERT